MIRHKCRDIDYGGSVLSHRYAPLSPEGRQRLVERCPAIGAAKVSRVGADNGSGTVVDLACFS
jgi:hypothetical protein